MKEMSEKVWIGAIYLKDEGGYEIILKSLNHYKNSMHNSRQKTRVSNQLNQ